MEISYVHFFCVCYNLNFFFIVNNSYLFLLFGRLGFFWGGGGDIYLNLVCCFISSTKHVADTQGYDFLRCYVGQVALLHCTTCRGHQYISLFHH